jgi:hypothetical protein
MAIPSVLVRTRLLLSAVVALFACTICTGTEPPQFELIANWSPVPRGGRVNALGLYGDRYVFASISNSFRVADISTWTAPRALWQIDLGAPARKIRFANYVYVCCGTNGLKVIDLLDSTPILKSTALAGEDVRDVAGWNSLVFVAVGAGGIVVLNVSNPDAPTIVARYETAGPALGLEIFGVQRSGVLTMYGWVAAGDAGALVLNITDPNAISVAKAFRGSGSVVGVGRSPYLTMHFVSTAKESYFVKINDEELAFSVQNTDLPFVPDRFAFDSVANIGYMIGADGSYCTFRGPGATLGLTFDAVAPQGVTAAALNQTYEVISTGDHTASVHRRANINPPATLEFDGSSSLIKAYPIVDTSQRTILLGDGVEGFRKFTLDSSNVIHGVGRDRIIKQRDFVPAGTNVIVVGDSIAIESFYDDFSGTIVSVPVDLVNPTGQKPAADSVVVLPPRSRGDIVRAVFSSQWSGLTILNITDPRNPVKLSSTGPLETGNPVFRDLAIRGTNLYAANGGIVSFSIQPDHSIRLVQRIATEGDADSMTLARSVAYVADGQFGLKIYDVSDSADMRLIGSCDTPGDARAVASLDHYVYVADSAAGVQVIDTSDLRAPKIIKNIPTADLTLDVATCAFPGQLYVANGLAGFSVYNIVPQNTTQLTILGIPNPLSTRTPPFLPSVEGVLNLTYGIRLTGGVAETDEFGQIVTTNAGTLHIIAETLGDSNYKPARAETVVEVIEAPRDPQTVDFPPLPDITIYDGPFFVNATASSGLPIEFTATQPAFVLGNQVEISGPGRVTVTATQSGNRDIAPASVSRTFEVRDFESAVAHDLQTRNPSLPSDQLLPGADPDHDGIPNGAEFLLGSNPISADSNEGHATAALVEVAGQRYLRITFRRGGTILPNMNPWLFALDLSKPPPYTWQGLTPAFFDEQGIGTYDLPIDSNTAIVRFVITYDPAVNSN